MTQLQRLEFSALEVELARRVRARGVHLVATPGSFDLFETFEGGTVPWSEVVKRYPAVPLAWWQNLAENSPIAQSHLWLGANGFLRGGSCSMGRLFAVDANATTLPQEALVEFLADEPNREFRNVLVHLDLYAF